MSDDGPDHPIDSLMAGIAAGGDDQLARASARRRSERRWLSQLAAESTTLAGVLLTWAEREEMVTITTAASCLRGRLNLVTTRLCTVELDSEDASVALIPTAGITSVEGSRADDGAAIEDNDSGVTDDRVPPTDSDLAAVLATLAPDRPLVILQLNGGGEISGTLLHVGHDVVALRRPSSVSHVPLDAIAACVLR